MKKNCVFSLFEDYLIKHTSKNLSIKKAKLISYTFISIIQYHRHFMVNIIILQKKYENNNKFYFRNPKLIIIGLNI